MTGEFMKSRFLKSFIYLILKMMTILSSLVSAMMVHQVASESNVSNYTEELWRIKSVQQETLKIRWDFLITWMNIENTSAVIWAVWWKWWNKEKILLEKNVLTFWPDLSWCKPASWLVNNSFRKHRTSRTTGFWGELLLHKCPDPSVCRSYIAAHLPVLRFLFSEDVWPTVWSRIMPQG